MHIASFIAGTANLIKLSSFSKEISSQDIHHTIIDVGIYTDEYHQMLFEELRLSRPQYVLNTNKLSYLSSLSCTIEKVKPILSLVKPDVFVVFGDLNSIVPACIAASQLKIPIAHIESGLRNGNPYDIEEFNRIVADRFSSYHFTISANGTQNLVDEGYDRNSILCAGNTIIDTLVSHLPSADDNVLNKWGLRKQSYALCAIHREINTNSRKQLKGILDGICRIQQEIKAVLLVYPSTSRAVKRHKLQTMLDEMQNVVQIPRQGYMNYLSLLRNSQFVITDSSGLQDECAYLGIPCLTCLEVTHRYDALSTGKNILVGVVPRRIHDGYQRTLNITKQNESKANWDGMASKRIVEFLLMQQYPR